MARVGVTLRGRDAAWAWSEEDEFAEGRDRRNYCAPGRRIFLRPNTRDTVRPYGAGEGCTSTLGDDFRLIRHTTS